MLVKGASGVPGKPSTVLRTKELGRQVSIEPKSRDNMDQYWFICIIYKFPVWFAFYSYGQLNIVWNKICYS